MLRITNISMPLDYSEEQLKDYVVKMLSINVSQIKSLKLYKRSIDARRKENIHFICTVDVETTKDQYKIEKLLKSNNIFKVEPYKYTLPLCKPLSYRPIVVGFGPAGIFAALILAQLGYRPIVLERGKDIDARTKDVKDFWNGSPLNEYSNVQFGEGGAGTFSDGKLNTGTKDIRARKVLDEFVGNGAPNEILYSSKPHIGTDKLKDTIKNLRRKIISLGGEIRFENKLVEILTQNKRVIGAKVECNNTTYNLESNHIVLAIGHSSRDTFNLLYNQDIFIEPKPFSVGARIEHLQSMIDTTQYGNFAGNPHLGAADYKLAVHLPKGRGVYTFCMCPGGSVVAASSEKNGVVTNGMSKFARNEKNANSALLVSVNSNDFKSDHPLAGIEFQRIIENKAFLLAGGNYNAPVQLVGDFLKNKTSKEIGKVTPSYKPGYSLCNLAECLPNYVIDSMRAGIIEMDKKLKGFASFDAVLTGVETRSSSPIRIVRNDMYESISTRGLYPCGEGAGYAGGIISAAVDGIKCAEKIATSTIEN